jgi:putative DNA primase/helicase
VTNKTNAEKFRDFCIKKTKHDPGEVRVTSESGYVRFSTNGTPQDKSGSYRFRGDWGTVKDFRAKTNKTHVWKTDRVLSDDEREVMEYELANATTTGVVTDEHRSASKRMREEYAAYKFDIPKGSQNHPYLEKKNIFSPGLFISKGELIVPLFNKNREHVNIQRILPKPYGEDGRTKFYYTGAEAANLHFIFGEITDRFIIAEGFATAATLHETTGWPAAITVSASSMPTVSKYLREFYPNAHIIIAADDDVSAENKGERKATEAAFAINAKISLPPFDRTVDPGTREFSDWNDYARVYGKETVAGKFFECAKDPQHETIEAIRGEAYEGVVPAPIAAINKTYFVSKDKGKFVIMEERPDIGDGPELWQHSLQDFTLTFCDQKVEVNGKSIDLGQY